MNKGLIIGIIILLVLIIIGGLVYYLVLMPSKYYVPVGVPAVNLNKPANNVPINQVPVSDSVSVKTFNVSIANFAFNPTNITIKAGDMVKWTNDDQVPHQIALSGSIGPILNTGDSYSYTFSNSGIFNYNCNIHPSMVGTVNVNP